MLPDPDWNALWHGSRGAWLGGALLRNESVHEIDEAVTKAWFELAPPARRPLGISHGTGDVAFRRLPVISIQESPRLLIEGVLDPPHVCKKGEVETVFASLSRASQSTSP